jgi:predicted kinase
MSKNVLIVMCGLPASGKSTYAQWLEESGMFKRVCPDLIRKLMYGDESIQGNGKEVFEYAYSQLKAFGDYGKNVVFDATNIDRKRRKELVKEMRPYFDVIICKWFSTPFATCVARNEERERQVPFDVMKRMALYFQPPTLDEGFDIVEEIKNYI